MGFIYKITNSINGKIYIGQTIRTLEERFNQHRFHKGCLALHRAIKKYGKDNFKIEEICQVLNEKYLDEAEIILIKQFNSLVPNGYNICIGGNSPMKNRKHSVKTKNKIRSYQLGRKKKPFSEEHRNNMSKARKGKLKGPRTEEVKKKISLANSGKNHGMFGKTGFNCPNFKCPILCLELNRIFGSQAEAARELNLQQSNIQKVISGKREHTGGYTFTNIEENHE